MRKNRKTIRKEASGAGPHSSGLDFLLILDALLADGVTRRAATDLLRGVP